MSASEVFRGHVLVASLHEDGIDWDIEHPAACPRDGWGIACPLGLRVSNAGVFEAMAGNSEAAAEGDPVDWHGPVVAAVAAKLLLADVVRVPFGYQYSSWYDYWGEFDEELVLHVEP